jgi:hypothetical protein
VMDETKKSFRTNFENIKLRAFERKRRILLFYLRQTQPAAN